jgi:hypothetical protein
MRNFDPAPNADIREGGPTVFWVENDLSNGSALRLCP